MTISRGDLPLKALVRRRSDPEALFAWLQAALAESQLPTHQAPLVQRLNMTISQLARTGFFDMRELSQLLKDARDHIEKTDGE